MEKQQVWVRDPNEGYIQGIIHEILPDEVEVVPLDKKFQKRTCSFDDIYPAGEYTTDVDDNCKANYYSNFLFKSIFHI